MVSYDIRSTILSSCSARTSTSCPILVYMTVPPLPHGTSPLELERYEEELLRPTGIRLSLPRPPNYWDGVGLGGIIIADQCGIAIGFEKGKGVRIDDFWRKSINCKPTPSHFWSQANGRRNIRFHHPIDPSPIVSSPNGIYKNTIRFIGNISLDNGHFRCFRFMDIQRTRRHGFIE